MKNISGVVPHEAKTLNRSFEIEKYARGYQIVVGTDEAGRGPLAGPVVAAACFIPLDVFVPGVQDSKTLTEAKREELYDVLVGHPKIQYAVHINEPSRIDAINILQVQDIGGYWRI